MLLSRRDLASRAGHYCSDARSPATHRSAVVRDCILVWVQLGSRKRLATANEGPRRHRRVGITIEEVLV